MLPKALRDLCARIPVLAAAVLAPAALLIAPVAGADLVSTDQVAAPVSDEALPCCAENLQAPALEPPADLPTDLPVDPPAEGPAEMLGVVAVSHIDTAPRLLPPGRAPEQGMQIKTILVARSVSAVFPQIVTMIGVRPDAKPWHPSGRAVDIMIPNAGSAEGVALGDAILAYAMGNAERFGVQDVIWRGTYYTPGGGASGSGYGHFDHVHITTTGGGYPTGNEEYVLDGA